MPKHKKDKHKKQPNKKNKTLPSTKTTDNHAVDSKVDFSTETPFKDHKRILSNIHKYKEGDHIVFTNAIINWNQLLSKDSYPLYYIEYDLELSTNFAQASQYIQKKQYSDAIETLNSTFDAYEKSHQDSSEAEIRLTMIALKSRLAYCHIQTQNYSNAYDDFQYMLPNLYLLKKLQKNEDTPIIMIQYVSTILNILAIYNIDDQYDIHQNVFNLCKTAIHHMSENKYENGLYDKLCGIFALTFLKYSMHDTEPFPREQLIAEYIDKIFIFSDNQYTQCKAKTKPILKLLKNDLNTECSQYKAKEKSIVTQLYFIKILCDLSQFELAEKLYCYLNMESHTEIMTAHHTEIYFYFATYYYSLQYEKQAKHNIEQSIKYCKKLLYDQSINDKLLSINKLVIHNYYSVMCIFDQDYESFYRLVKQDYNFCMQTKISILEHLLHQFQLQNIDIKALFLVHQEQQAIKKQLKQELNEDQQKKAQHKKYNFKALLYPMLGLNIEENDVNLALMNDPLEIFVSMLIDESSKIPELPKNDSGLADDHFAYCQFLGQILFASGQYDKSYDVLTHVINNRSYNFQGQWSRDKAIMTYIQSCVMLKKFDELQNMCKQICSNKDNRAHDIYIVMQFLQTYLNQYHQSHHLTDQEMSTYNVLSEYAKNIATPVKHGKTVLNIEKDYFANARALIIDVYCEYHDTSIINTFIESSEKKYALLLDGFLAEHDQMKSKLLDYYTE